MVELDLVVVEPEGVEDVCFFFFFFFFFYEEKRASF